MKWEIAIVLKCGTPLVTYANASTAMDAREHAVREWGKNLKRITKVRQSK